MDHHKNSTPKTGDTSSIPFQLLHGATYDSRTGFISRHAPRPAFGSQQTIGLARGGQRRALRRLARENLKAQRRAVRR